MKLFLVLLFIIFTSGMSLNATQFELSSEESIDHPRTGMSTGLQVLLAGIPIIIVAILSYYAGKSIEFRKEKQKVYSESIQPLLASYYGSTNPTEEELNLANLKILLYSNRDVALKLQQATRILIDNSRGDITTAFQHLLCAMRSDLQLMRWLSWQRLQPIEFTHIYFKFQKDNDEKAA